MKPLAIDMEMSGLDPEACGIWQIGAVDLNNGNEFFEESRIDNEDLVEEDALKIIGKTKDDLRDNKKQSQKEMLEKFFAWCDKASMKNLLMQNFLDFMFLRIKAKKYGLKLPFKHRAFDLHSVAQTVYAKSNKEFSVKEEFPGNFSSNLGLKEIIEYCGMKDNRIQMREGDVIKEGNPHNALEDAKLTGECFSRLLYGENLFPEFEKYPIPEVLKK